MQPFKFSDVEQGGEEWHLMRATRMTSSNLASVMANYGKAFGGPAKKYAVQIAIAQITGNLPAQGYTSSDMDRGTLQEPMACALYEQETFCDVAPGGFFCNDELGCSPDGLPDDGLIEIKSVLSHIQYATAKKGGIPSANKWQCIGNLKFTGRKWLDFVSYCAEYPVGRQLYIHRITPDQYQEEFAMIDDRVGEFIELVATVRKSIEGQ